MYTAVSALFVSSSSPDCEDSSKVVKLQCPDVVKLKGCANLVVNDTFVKTLYIVRHAKSSWDDDSLADFDRPLNERGKRDAPSMAKRLKEKNIVPDLLLSSPAKRAFSTAKRFAETLGYNEDKIKTDRRLYHADGASMIAIVRETKNVHDTLIMFGHNPGLTDCVNALMNERKFIDNVPTCGVVAFQFNTDDWTSVRAGEGKLLFFDYPKNTAR